MRILKRNGSFTRLSLLVIALLASAGTAAAAEPLYLATTPLPVTGAVRPNVMLLIDNSESMNNIVWAEAFDPATAYPHWGNGNWKADDKNRLLSELVSASSNCTGSTVVEGAILQDDGSTVTKCLTLPDPAGVGKTHYTGRYLDYLFENHLETDDLSQAIPNETRMEVAKRVAGALVQDTPHMRFGVSAFNPNTDSTDPGPGGSILAQCSDDPQGALDAVSGLTADSKSPLAETFYEITRYFRGMEPFQGQHNIQVGSYTGPIEEPCQKNFVVVISDGAPTEDETFPSNDPDDANGRLPDWDQDNNDPADTGESPQYLDDLAGFGNDIDLSPLEGQQKLNTFTVSLSGQNAMLEAAADPDHGNGQFFTAKNAGELSDALQRALSRIAQGNSSITTVATNSTRLNSGTLIFQALFRPDDWSGDIVAYPLDSMGNVKDPVWRASEKLPDWESRKIFTYDTGNKNGIAFTWSSLADKSLLKDEDGGNVGQDRVEYLRGNSANEIRNGGTFRDRPETPLGDIVNSNPVFVGGEDFGYERLTGQKLDNRDVAIGQEGLDYPAFLSQKRQRPPMVYVGANDGMLHGFNASGDATGGVEKLAYIPAAVHHKLARLTGPDYNDSHLPFVDSSPWTGDAYVRIGSDTSLQWHTVLASSLGGGGRSIFALDVTEPETFGTDDVLWEFGAGQDADMGYVFGRTSIVRMATPESEIDTRPRWAVVFGNGYMDRNDYASNAEYEAANNASLFIVFVDGGQNGTWDEGTDYVKITVDGGSAPNGLSTPIPVDADGDKVTDYVYAGDLQGNLWKFDVTGRDHTSWHATRLFTALDNDGNRQPITARPEVTRNASGDRTVLFGTGRYLAIGDNEIGDAPQTQTFYGIIDPAQDSTEVSGRSELLEQTITQVVSQEGHTLRVTSDHTLTAERGWYMDLPEPGERVTSNATVRGGRIIFTTLIPSLDPCSAGGTGYLMELDAFSGSRLSRATFDLNDDRVFDDQDMVEITTENGDTILVPPSGLKSTQGIINTPAVIGAGDIEYKYTSGSAGGNPGKTGETTSGRTGRVSWRQLR